MQGRLVSRAALLFATLAIGACLVLPLCSSVLAAAAGDSKSLRGKDGSEVATGVTRSSLDVVSPEGTSDESSQSRRASGRKTSVARWRSSSTGVLRRFGKGPKFLLSMSAIIGTAFLLSRAGNVLLRCLADTGGQQKSPSEGPEGEACERLREWSENEGEKLEATGLAKLFPSGSLRANLPKKMVMTVGLLSLLAIALATPIPTLKEGGVSPSTPSAEVHSDNGDGLMSTTTSLPDVSASQSTSSTSYHPEVTTPEIDEDTYFGTWSGNDAENDRRRMPGNAAFPVGEPLKKPPPVADGTYPVVEIKGSEVTIGERWADKAGKSKAGSEAAFVQFEYKGKNFKVRLSSDTENALKEPHESVRDDLLEKIKTLLTQAPTTMEDDFFEWGEKTGDTVSGIVDEDADVPFEMYIPKGAFGILEDDQTAPENKYQGWFDFWIIAYHILYVGNTGRIPTLPPPTGLPTTALTPAAEGAANGVIANLIWGIARLIMGN